MTTQHPPEGWVPEEVFSQAVDALPLVSIDLLVVNAQEELLLGLRRNRPARDWWFSPGARIRKNEELEQVLERIWLEELGQTQAMPPVQLLGASDHMYADSAFSDEVPTHYVNLPYLVLLPAETVLTTEALPQDQHSQWQWMPLEQAANDTKVHTYVRAYAHTICLINTATKDLK
jgi:colanic acid biosynthesis protein WcaH